MRVPLLNKHTRVETKVYVKPTNTGLLLHYKSHVDDRYKRGLLKTMLDRAYRLSSNWHYFSEECDRLKLMFSRLKYPDNLVNSTISRFVAAKASDQPVSSPAVSDRLDPIRVVLPFKDQASADIVRAQLKDLSHKIQTTVQPVFVSQKIERDLKLREAKPPIVNQQCLVYKFQCDLCDAGYVGFTRRHLHQRVEEHKNSSSSIGKHFRDKHSLAPKDLTKNFSVLMKCTNKFDCLVYEMFFIHELRDLLSMYNLTQFVLRFLISFLISFLLVVLFVHFYCPFTPVNFVEKFLHFLCTYTPISKNVVGENGEWQLTNGNCTTERNCGFHINEFFAWRETRELKQPRRRQLHKPHKFAYLTVKNSIFARFARAFFIF